MNPAWLLGAGLPKKHHSLKFFHYYVFWPGRAVAVVDPALPAVGRTKSLQRGRWPWCAAGLFTLITSRQGADDTGTSVIVRPSTHAFCLILSAYAEWRLCGDIYSDLAIKVCDTCVPHFLFIDRRLRAHIVTLYLICEISYFEVCDPLSQNLSARLIFHQLTSMR